jgi:hypothetical protein
VTRTDRFVAYDAIDVAPKMGAARREHVDGAAVRSADNGRLEHGQADRDIGRDDDRRWNTGRLFAPQHGDKRAQEGQCQADGEDALQDTPAGRGGRVVLISDRQARLLPRHHLEDSTVTDAISVTTAMRAISHRHIDI